MREFEADVAVIGGGAAGLAAAITAAENGAKVIVLEKANTTGGCANMAMGLLGVETKLQKEKLVDITRERAFEKFMDYTHWRSNAKLVKKYIDQSAETIEWLIHRRWVWSLRCLPNIFRVQKLLGILLCRKREIPVCVRQQP